MEDLAQGGERAGGVGEGPWERTGTGLAKRYRFQQVLPSEKQRSRREGALPHWRLPACFTLTSPTFGDSACKATHK